MQRLLAGDQVDWAGREHGERVLGHDVAEALPVKQAGRDVVNEKYKLLWGVSPRGEDRAYQLTMYQNRGRWIATTGSIVT
jgi:hypothetical protein